MRGSALRAATCALGLLLGASSAARADVLEPLRFSALAPALAPAAPATIAIQTGNDPACMPAGPSLIVNGGAPFCGAVDDQGGSADYVGGVWVPGSQGIPEIAVFTFGSIDLASGVVVSVTGTRALALLSQTHASIHTTIAVNGALGVIDAAGAGGSGGFRGGLGTGTGEGPGGGVGGACPSGGIVCSVPIGSAGFGGPADPGTPPAPGALAYGDLTGFLQGGSGGGGILSNPPMVAVRGGGGGGGALEIGAVTTLTLGANAALQARGRRGTFNATIVVRNSGVGSGGGVRLHAASLVLDGSSEIYVDIFEASPSVTQSWPGGGRALLQGIPGPFIVGSSVPASVPAMVALIRTGGAGGTTNGFEGTIHLSPGFTMVPPTQALDLAATVELQAQTYSVPQILFHQAGDVWVLSGGAVSVPANFRTSRELVLGSPSSLVSGTGPVTNVSAIRGGGQIAVTLQNADTGQVRVGRDERLELTAAANTNDGAIEVIGGTLVSAQALTNQPGGTLDAIHGALQFAGSGLANFGAVHLIETTVSGPVANAVGGTIGVAGTARFTGLVRGPGAFTGGGGTVIFDGGFAPGDSAAIVALGGGATFGVGNTLSVEIGGLAAGAQHDRVDVAGTASLGGALALTLVSGFTPTPGQSVTLLTHGARTGEFAAIVGVQQAGLLDLAVAYGPGSTTLMAARRGDVNLDGSVNAIDVAIVQANQGASTSAYGSGDVDGDGSVDAADLGIVQSQVPAPIPVLAPVGLLALALLLLVTGLVLARGAALGRLIAVVLATGSLAAPPRAAADVLDPLAFASLGPSLTLLGGSTLVINTGNAAACGGPSLVVNGGAAVCGVVDDQGGTADYLGGVWVSGSQGIPEIAVFTYDEIDLQSGVAVTVTGTRALALLSRGDVSINTTIALSAALSFAIGTAGSPGPGGFRGGLGTESGHGPGGGTGGTRSPLQDIGGGGFGASGTGPGGGAAYGDLSQLLQGGSGGGGISNLPVNILGGGGGGGALEIGARGFLNLGANGRLLADGATGAGFAGATFAGAGSGGGIRVHGHPLLIQPGAQVVASASVPGTSQSSSGSFSAGGRVLIEGRLLQFTVGDSASVSALTSGIDVTPQSANAAPQGMIDATPDLTLVPSGQSLDLALVPVVLQAQVSFVPGVLLRYRNLRVARGATVSVPASYRNRGDLWLDSRTDPPTDPPTARVIGTGPLINERTIHGSGTLEVTLQNTAGATIAAGKSDLLRLDGPANTNAGEIDLVGGTLRVTTALLNDAGGELNLIDATLVCTSPLLGTGALRAIDSTLGASCTPP